MLEALINSKAKKRILNICFKYPKRSFYVNELRTMDAGQTSKVSAALRELVQAEVLQETRKKQKRYVRINPRFKLYDELKDLVAEGKLPADDEICKMLKQLPNARLIVLSGIFTFEPHLPVDILVVGEVNRKSFYRLVLEIEKLTGQEINYAIMGKQEYEYRLTMSDRFIRDIFDNNHLIVLNNLKKLH